MQALLTLIGTWQGTGYGDYPTIDAFDYREILTFEANQDQDKIHYVQRTWRHDTDGKEIDSHWESGFIQQLDDGSIEIANVQSSGRMELLVGEVKADGDAFMLVLESVQLANDMRMKATSRVWRWTDTHLTYDMNMATIDNPELRFHLSATLSKG